MADIIVKIDASKCKGCYLCVDACPKNVLAAGKDTHNKSGYFAVGAVDMSACIGCANCALMCPDGAIGIYKSSGD